VKTLEKSDDGFDIVAFGRRDLVTGSRAKQRSPRFWWVSDIKTFYRALAKADVSAGVLALEEPSKLTSLGKYLEDHLTAWRKPLILVGTPKLVGGPTVMRLFGSPMVKYLPTHVGEAGVENTVEVMKRVALQHAVDRLQQKGILPDTGSTKLLFNPKSQRLDFKRVAKLFGIPERRLAAIIGVLPTTANKTPDSRPIHEKLLPFERIARGLSELDDDQETFRRWLNTPNPELSDFTPLQVIERGKADVVAGMVSSALLGQPT
jgi:hypothetical protein